MILDFLCLGLTIVFCWSTLVVLAGLVKRPKLFPRQSDHKLHFTVLICARNEENVIALPVASIRDANYPADKRDIIVLADNCSDHTREIAEKMGATVWEKHIPSMGKGDVLKWGMEQIALRMKDDPPDAIAVFDADNIVSAHWFEATNDALLAGAQVTTGCRHATNARKNLITGWYAAYWDVMNELSNRVRTNLGLSAKLTGTGFSFRYRTFQEQGWDTCTMVEDVEFTVQCNIAGTRVVYVPRADYSDEQPEGVHQMWRQLCRWTTGGWQVARIYGRPWIRAMMCTPSFRLFDSYFAILTGMSVAFVHLFNILSFIVNHQLRFFLTIVGTICVMSWFMSAAAVALSRRGPVPRWTAIVSFPVFSLILSATVLWTLVHPTRKWKPIVHGN